MEITYSVTPVMDSLLNSEGHAYYAIINKINNLCVCSFYHSCIALESFIVVHLHLNLRK
jgi:hypothetical protein